MKNKGLKIAEVTTRIVKMENRYTTGGKFMCTFSCPVDVYEWDGGQENKTTAWYRCVSWGKAAEYISKYARENGRIILKDAYLQTENGLPVMYNGAPKWKLTVNAIEVIDWNNDGDRSEPETEEEPAYMQEPDDDNPFG